MTTPEQPDGQGLTRKQLRELQKRKGKGGAKNAAAAKAASAPVAAVPAAAAPEVTVPDVAVPDVAVPEVAVPDVAVPEVAVPDVAVPEVAVPDVSVPAVGEALPVSLAKDTPPVVAEPEDAGEGTPAPNVAVTAPAAPDIPPPPPLPAPSLNLPRAAAPVVAPAPTPDAQVDLGAAPLTRRQAREQERIRTASVPVITPEVAAMQAAAWVPPAAAPPAIPVAAPEGEDASAEIGVETPAVAEDAQDGQAPGTEEITLEALFGAPETDENTVTEAELVDDAPEDGTSEGDPSESDSTGADVVALQPVDDDIAGQAVAETVIVEDVSADDVTHGAEVAEPAAPADDPVAEAPTEAAASDEISASEAEASDLEDEADAGSEAEELVFVDEDADEDDGVEDAAFEPRPVLRAEFGSELLAGSSEPAVTLPPSFDELIARNGSATGSMSMPNALILSQAPSPMVGPVTATGEVLITGSMALPEGLGSRGHAPGVADGKEIDAVLVDGELPAASSPTPIAASAAISTVKGTGEIIRPPAPEKGNRLMLTLAITAGVLALALVGVLILAFVTGVF